MCVSGKSPRITPGGALFRLQNAQDPRYNDRGIDAWPKSFWMTTDATTRPRNYPNIVGVTFVFFHPGGGSPGYPVRVLKVISTKTSDKFVVINRPRPRERPAVLVGPVAPVPCGPFAM